MNWTSDPSPKFLASIDKSLARLVHIQEKQFELDKAISLSRFSESIGVKKSIIESIKLDAIESEDE